MNKSQKILGFDDRWLMAIGIPLVALVLCSVLFAGSEDMTTAKFFMPCYPICIFLTAVYWVAFRYIIVSVRRHAKLQSNTLMRICFEVATIVLLYFILDQPLEYFIHEVLNLNDKPYHPHRAVEIFSSLICSLFITAIYELMYIQRQLDHTTLEKERLTRAHIQSQLDGLRSQIQPHFLFNSLNTLAGLIPIDEKKAVNYVQKLSNVFRYILEIKDEPLISLEKEIQFLSAYTFLLKERFGNNLIIDIQIADEHLNDMVVPLSLQILFENAIKHNTLTRDQPLTVHIYINSAGKLTVENNLQLKVINGETTRLGLENIEKRYRFVVDESVDIIRTFKSFAVSLPLISAPSS